jgi:hypothetical protein
MAKKKKTTKGYKKTAKKQARKGTTKTGAPTAKKRRSSGAGARPAMRLAEDVIPDVLGSVKASAIVTGCADVTDTTKKLGDIGLDLLIFQNCVKRGIQSAGFKPTAIPASASNTLDDVINAIAQSERT